MPFNSDGLELLRFVLDVLVMTALIYSVVRLFRGTRAFQAFLWLLLVVLLYTLSNDRILGLTTVRWFLSNFMGSLVILLIVLFQDEIRRGVGRLAWLPGLARPRLGAGAAESVEEIVHAVRALSTRRIGALMVVERTADLRNFETGAIRLDAALDRHVLFLLFVPAYENPTHDGAVLIRNNRIVAAHCILPLAESPEVRTLGTRHRAALGMSEQTDALVIVVSEESGRISVASQGQLELGIQPDRLRERLLTGNPEAAIPEGSGLLERLRRTGRTRVRGGEE